MAKKRPVATCLWGHPVRLVPGVGAEAGPCMDCGWALGEHGVSEDRAERGLWCPVDTFITFYEIAEYRGLLEPRVVQVTFPKVKDGVVYYPRRWKAEKEPTYRTTWLT